MLKSSDPSRVNVRRRMPTLLTHASVLHLWSDAPVDSAVVCDTCPQKITLFLFWPDPGHKSWLCSWKVTLMYVHGSLRWCGHAFSTSLTNVQGHVRANQRPDPEQSWSEKDTRGLPDREEAYNPQSAKYCLAVKISVHGYCTVCICSYFSTPLMLGLTHTKMWKDLMHSLTHALPHMPVHFISSHIYTLFYIHTCMLFTMLTFGYAACTE